MKSKTIKETIELKENSSGDEIIAHTAIAGDIHQITEWSALRDVAGYNIQRFFELNSGLTEQLFNNNFKGTNPKRFYVFTNGAKVV